MGNASRVRTALASYVISTLLVACTTPAKVIRACIVLIKHADGATAVPIVSISA
jgi:hypothetical protein